MRAPLMLALLAIGACLAPPLRADTASDIQVVSDCLNKAPADLPAGLENLTPICPALEQVLIDSGVSQQIGGKWRQKLSPASLQDLLSLMQRYQASAASEAPRVSSVAGIVQTLRAVQPTHSWWQRIKDWVRELFLTPTQSADSSWLLRLLSKVVSIPAWVQQAVLYGGMAIILIAAAWIIWREVAVARARAGQRPGSRRPGSAVIAPMQGASLTISQLEAAAVRDRPALLLRMLVGALVASGRIGGERSLTHSELARRGSFDDGDQQRRFARLSRLAEQTLYGPQQTGARPDSPDIEQTLMEGRQLYEQLAHLPAGRGLAS